MKFELTLCKYNQQIRTDVWNVCEQYCWAILSILDLCSVFIVLYM